MNTRCGCLGEATRRADEMLAAIPHYHHGPLFTPRKKAAFRFAELMAGNHKQIRHDLYGFSMRIRQALVERR
jgi:hypothetical protein